VHSAGGARAHGGDIFSAAWVENGKKEGGKPRQVKTVTDFRQERERMR
jgi:hypothetical protein